MDKLRVHVFESEPICEYLMCKLLIDYAKKYYRDPKNQAAFQAWLKEKSKEQ